MCPYIQIGKVTLESYTVFNNLGTVCGLFAAYLVLDKYCYKEKNNWKMVLFLLITMAASAPAATAVKELFSQVTGRGATHFLVRVTLACMLMPLFLRIFWKETSCLDQSLNSAALYFMIQHFFNRIACLLNGCCGGISVPFMKEPLATQLFEAGMAAVISIFVLAGIRREKEVFRKACAFYGAVIFVSEYLIDQPEAGRICTMTSVQMTALLLILWMIFFQKICRAIGLADEQKKQSAKNVG